MSISNQAVNSEATAVAVSSTIVEIQFNNQTLFATLVDDVPYVAIKPICENLGLDWNGQYQRIMRHPVLKSTMCMIHTVAADGKTREMAMLQLSKLNGWMFGIDSSRVNENSQEVVILYQEECFDVLADHFLPKTPYGLKDIPHQSFAPLHLTQQMCGHIQRLANERAAADGVHYSTTYRQLKDAFECNTYTDIPVTKYGKVCRWFGVEPIYPIPVYSMIDNDELQRLLHIERGIMADPKLLPAPEGAAWAQVKDSEIVIDGKQHEELKAAHAQLEALKTGDETALPKVRGKRWTIIAKSERVVEFAVLDALYKTEAKVGLYEVLDGMFPTPRPTATQTVIEKQRLGELEFIAKYAAALMQQ